MECWFISPYENITDHQKQSDSSGVETTSAMNSPDVRSPTESPEITEDEEEHREAIKECAIPCDKCHTSANKPLGHIGRHRVRPIYNTRSPEFIEKPCKECIRGSGKVQGHIGRHRRTSVRFKMK